MSEKALIKAGGKRGIELIGFNEMGGQKFFVTIIPEAQGSVENMEIVMKGLREDVDESADERKGGAGPLGVFVLSNDDDNLVGHCIVPPQVSHLLTAQDWVKSATEGFPIEIIRDVCEDSPLPVVEGETSVQDTNEESDDEDKEPVVPKFTEILFSCKADTSNNIFTLKVKDDIQAQALKALRDNSLMCDDSDDDDDYPCYGDDDFDNL